MKKVKWRMLKMEREREREEEERSHCLWYVGRSDHCKKIRRIPSRLILQLILP